MRTLIEESDIKKVLDFLKEDDERTLKEQLEMCQIPAPSFMEEKKAAYVFEKMKDAGLEDVHIDEVGNVLGMRKGILNGPTIVLAAHTDTVFPIETDVTLKKDGNRYICPGINDDTRAVAEILSIARGMTKNNIRGNGDIIFCANVCEEGLGDLKGVKHLFAKRRDIDGFVTIDNQATGGIIYTATGSNRFLITFRGTGGHSFSDFGLPNPIHAMGRAMAVIADFEVPVLPKTTFNVGVIHGGTSVNTIAAEASMLVDIRSDSTKELERLTKELKYAVHKAVQEENARWKNVNEQNKVSVIIEQKGKRPAGTQPKDCLIVRAAWEAAEALGVEPEYRTESSTDANIPISMGIPAIAVGRGGNEGGIHTIQEWFEPIEAYKGTQKNFLIVMALSGYKGFEKYQIKK